MVIKNADKAIGCLVNDWICTSVNVSFEQDPFENVMEYWFDFFKQVPVVSSPFQTYHTMTKTVQKRVKIKLFNSDRFLINLDGEEFISETKNIRTINNFLDEIGKHLN